MITSLFTSFQLVRKDDWYFRIFDFPHVQLTVLNLLFLTTHLVFADYGSWIDLSIGAVGLLAVFYQLAIIYPYTSVSSKQVQDTNPAFSSTSISVLEANVLMYNTNYQALVNLVKDFQPDIVVTLETDEKWKDGLKELESLYKQHILLPLDNTYGICFYSNVAFKDASVSHHISEEVPSIEMTLEPEGGQEVKLFVVHPEPPSPTEKDLSTPRDAELVLVGRMAKECTLPVIITGDLNDVAWSHTSRLFQRIGGLLDPRVGRGFFNTFHAKYLLFRWPLDHIFVSSHFTVDKIQRLPAFGSDHFPILIQLSIPFGTPDNETAPVASKEDKKEARETVKAAKAP
ncbi:MAG: endonuclease/exonuclease/phosphatase family protein [Imperialibacter sp.]